MLNFRVPYKSDERLTPTIFERGRVPLPEGTFGTAATDKSVAIEGRGG